MHVRSGQVNGRNIFIDYIFGTIITRYEKESVTMRAIVYFKLQNVAPRDYIRSN